MSLEPSTLSNSAHDNCGLDCSERIDCNLNFVVNFGLNFLCINLDDQREPHFWCQCTLINQILRIRSILQRFCTLNYNISTGCVAGWNSTNCASLKGRIRQPVAMKK